MPYRDDKKLSNMHLYQAGHVMQTIDRRNDIIVFHLAGCLTRMVRFRETAPRKTADNNIKPRGGGVGLVLDNHDGGGGNLSP